MYEGLDDAFARDFVPPRAGLVELQPVEQHVADPKRAKDEVGQRHVAGDEIHPTFVRRKVDVVVTRDGLENLGFE